MNFFEKLQTELPNADITIRVMGKDGTLTVNVMPGSANSTTPPVLMTGTGAEIDEAIMSAIAETEITTGLSTNIGKASKLVDDAKQDKPVSKQLEQPKKDKPNKNKPSAPAVALFGDEDEVKVDEPTSDDDETSDEPEVEETQD